MDYDVFICHASEDKDSFVRPLAESLVRIGLRVWYDEFELRPGSSLRESIDRGLASSRACVVVLSPRFLGRAWPEWELNGIVQRHLHSNLSVLIPIWLDISADAVRRASPSLADLVAIRATPDVQALARQISGLVRPMTRPSTDVNKLAEHALQLLLMSIGATRPDRVCACLHLLRGDRLIVVAAVGRGAESLPLYDIPVAASIAGLAARRDASVVVESATAVATNPYRQFLSSEGAVESEIATPLFSAAGEVLGVVSFTSTEPSAFTLDNLQPIEMALQVCGPFIETLIDRLLPPSA